MTIFLLFAVAAGCVLSERLWPANDLPRVQNWWGRIVLVNTVQLGLVLLAGITWNQWFSQASLFKINDLFGPLASALIAYLISTIIYYFWHRLRHESKFFWRFCHQLHHSPRRIEILTSFYKHPVEIFINSLLSSAVVYLLLGTDVLTASLYTFFIAVAEFFYHWNVRTPQWLGYLIQRPESHRLHHQYQRHTRNYADLPFLDMFFGTFSNAGRDKVACGFDDWREDRFEDILAFRDLHGKEAAAISPLHFLPSCIGCSKRWACTSARNEVTAEKVVLAADRNPEPGPMNLRNLAALLLLLLGSLQMLGGLLDSKTLKAVGAATVFAPYPKVFCDVDGLEPFASRFTLMITEEDGTRREIEMDPELYSKLPGPYNRRNVYGAALSYAPRMPEALWRSVFDYGLRSGGPLRQAFDLSAQAEIKVRIATQTRDRKDVWLLESPPSPAL